MDDELDALVGGDQADLEEPAAGVTADDHRQIVVLEHADGVAIGVDHVVVGDPVSAGTGQHDRIHRIKLP